MTMLSETKTNRYAETLTRATDARLAKLERQLAEQARDNEQRFLALRDATVDFVAAELAPLAEENAVLKKRMADLEQKFEQKMTVDQQVHEIATRLEERQAQRDRERTVSRTAISSRP
jgi:uncharacterized protein YigA (DUF484 family)